MRVGSGESLGFGVRVVTSVALAAFIVLGPFYRQVLHGEARYFRAWRMFQGLGKDLCDVRYLHRRPDGQTVGVDRYALLGVKRPPYAPEEVWKIEKASGAESLGRRLCERLPPGERDLRRIARCGSDKGWQSVDDGTRNLCAVDPLPTGPAAP